MWLSGMCRATDLTLFLWWHITILRRWLQLNEDVLFQVEAFHWRNSRNCHGPVLHHFPRWFSKTVCIWGALNFGRARWARPMGNCQISDRSASSRTSISTSIYLLNKSWDLRCQQAGRGVALHWELQEPLGSWGSWLVVANNQNSKLFGMMILCIIDINWPTCFCQRGEDRASVLYIFANLHIRYVTSWVWGWGGGDVNVHVNLRHMRMLRHVMGLGLG